MTKNYNTTIVLEKKDSQVQMKEKKIIIIRWYTNFQREEKLGTIEMNLTIQSLNIIEIRKKLVLMFDI